MWQTNHPLAQPQTVFPDPTGMKYPPLWILMDYLSVIKINKALTLYPQLYMEQPQYSPVIYIYDYSSTSFTRRFFFPPYSPGLQSYRDSPGIHIIYIDYRALCVFYIYMCVYINLYYSGLKSNYIDYTYFYNLPLH